MEKLEKRERKKLEMSKKNKKKKIKQSQTGYRQSKLSILEIMQRKALNGDEKAQKFVEAVSK